jgi:hypothetical protein
MTATGRVRTARWVPAGGLDAVLERRADSYDDARI